MISGLGHVAVRTSNLMESLRYYTEILGLQEAFRMYGADGALGTIYLYIAPNQFLELFANGTRRCETGGDAIGMCHICLQVSDIEEACRTIRERGGPLDSDIIVGKSKCLQLWTHDPDGTAIELMELPEESLQVQATRRLNAGR